YGRQWYDYGDVSRERAWAPIVGSFTRYGDVLPLVDSVDDRYVIFGPGDEVALEFDSAAAPLLPPGWTRDFLIYTDAWLKDADLNTLAGGTVEPLPFHRMSRYPYGADEAFPTDALHRRFVETYNTRRVPTPPPPPPPGEGGRRVPCVPLSARSRAPSASPPRPRSPQAPAGATPRRPP